MLCEILRSVTDFLSILSEKSRSLPLFRFSWKHLVPRCHDVHSSRRETSAGPPPPEQYDGQASLLLKESWAPNTLIFVSGLRAAAHAGRLCLPCVARPLCVEGNSRNQEEIFVLLLKPDTASQHRILKLPGPGECFGPNFSSEWWELKQKEGPWPKQGHTVKMLRSCTLCCRLCHQAAWAEHPLFSGHWAMKGGDTSVGATMRPDSASYSPFAEVSLDVSRQRTIKVS